MTVKCNFKTTTDNSALCSLNDMRRCAEENCIFQKLLLKISKENLITRDESLCDSRLK